MKNYKLQLLLLIVALISQINIVKAQTKIGIKAGMNFSNVIMKDEDGNQTATQSMPGFHVGANVEIPIADDFYIQPGVLYSTKGFKQKENGFAYSTNFRATASYIEVPVNVLYKPKLAAGRLLLGAGPYLAYGTGGTWRSDTNIQIGDVVGGNVGKIIFRKDLADGEYETYLYGKPLDYGVNFLVGYEFSNQLSVQLNAQAGLANLEPAYGGIKHGGKLKNTNFGISVGYKLEY
jgi:carbohydrate-binding DOMON domain-containing protein